MANAVHARAVDVLSRTERDRLAELERTIERGLATFIEVGSALAEIRDSRLYRETHDTFDAYCRDRWQMGRHRAYQLIRSAEVATRVDHGQHDIPAPSSERQVRPLTVLPTDEQPAAWQEAVETARAEGRDQPTARHVEEVVRKRRAPEREPEPEPDAPDDADAEVDPIAEWERAEKRIEELEALVASLQSNDLAREVAVWRQKYAQLEGRLHREMATRAEAEREAKYAKKKLAEIRRELGVVRDKDIIPAIQTLREWAGA